MPQRTQAIEFEISAAETKTKSRKTGTGKLFTGTEKNESALEGQDKYEGGEEDVEVMRDNAM